MKTKLLYLVTEESYFCSHRLQLACAALRQGFEVVVVTHLDKKSKKLTELGFKVIPVAFSRKGGNLFREISLIIKLIKIYRQEKPDIVQHIALQPIIYGSIAAFLAGRRKVVNTLAGLGFVFISPTKKAYLLRAIFKKIFRWFFNLSHYRVIVQNPDDLQLLLNLGVRQKNIKLIYGSGVDLQKFVVTPEPATIPTFTLVSRMLWHKGIYEFVEAARYLQELNIKFSANLVGDVDYGNPAAIPPAEVQNWHAKKEINWLGQQDDIVKIWQQSHIAVLPSYREGLPKALLEAAACGKPIITTDVPGCREVVQHGRNGYLVPAKDSKALATAMQKLLVNPELRNKMGQESRKMAAEKFSLEYVIRETLAVYTQLVGARRARGF
jgi:glycosyltransferase involved in cell wall biosynthesis